MAGGTISTTITNTVTLGSATYSSPLTVTTTGDVAVTAVGSIGVYGPASSGTLINFGAITGGTGSSEGIIGIGVDLLGGSTAINSGVITGGVGFSGSNGGGSGGVGVSLVAGAMLINQTDISGGLGGSNLGGGPIGSPGDGGAGLALDGGIAVNSGVISGGYVGGGPGGEEVNGGAGVVLLAGMVTNTGTISGGGAGSVGVGGDGVSLSASATLANDGTIIGGYAGIGGSGISVAAGGTLIITGVVIGGGGSSEGGEGVDPADGVSLDNMGTVMGGAGPSARPGAGGTGVGLGSGDTLTNGATIIGGAGGDDGGGGAGVGLAAGGLLINTAFISGGSVSSLSPQAAGDGVYGRGGTMTNVANATITGGLGGVTGEGGGIGVELIGATGSNAGIITGGGGAASNDDGGAGVSLTGGTTFGATFTNSGSIGGGLGAYSAPGGYLHGGNGVVLGSSTIASTLDNSGRITGGNGDNVAPAASIVSYMIVGGVGAYIGSHQTMRSDGTIVPWATDTLINSGTLIGGAGVYVGAGATLYDRGYVSGGDAVSLAGNGTVINTGTILSGVGVELATGGMLEVPGTVAGGVYAGVTADAVLFAGAGTLVVDARATFIGQVVGSTSAIDTMYLGNYGRIPGTLSGLGTQFTNFSQITVGSGASWTLTGANTVASGATLTELSGATLTDTGTLTNDGSIVLDPSNLVVAGLIGSGPVAVDPGSTLDVQGTVSAGETIQFGSSGAYLALGAPDDVNGSVTNFDTDETIFLNGIDDTSVSYADGQLTFAGGDFALALGNGGTVMASAGTDGTDVFVTLCFCANTLILTPTGERPVQELSPGDLVTTHRGEARPIVWVGVGKVLTTRGQRGAATPVIVRKGALADNVPNRDLRVTKGHAFWFGGALIPVEFLVNHRSIEWDDRAQEVSLYHVELATHDVLVANGAAAESYRDDGNRWLFRNANSGWDLPPQAPCAPVLTGGAVVDAVWRRLLERAGPRPGFALTDDPDLHLVVDGRRVDAAEPRGAAYVFPLPARVGPMRVASRSAVPAELGVARDPRLLGVALRRIALRQGTRFQVVDAADCRLSSRGFHPFEQGDGLRWTDGDAVLPATLFEGFEGPLELVLHVGGTTQYPMDGGGQARAAA